MLNISLINTRKRQWVLSLPSHFSSMSEALVPQTARNVGWGAMPLHKQERWQCWAPAVTPAAGASQQQGPTWDQYHQWAAAVPWSDSWRLKSSSNARLNSLDHTCNSPISWYLSTESKKCFRLKAAECPLTNYTPYSYHLSLLSLSLHATIGVHNSICSMCFTECNPVQLLFNTSAWKLDSQSHSPSPGVLKTTD